MAVTGWIEKRMDHHQQAARARMINQHRRSSARKRGWSRDAARVMLVATVLVLGVLAVEIGRKAVTVLNHADVASVAPSIG